MSIQVYQGQQVYHDDRFVERKVALKGVRGMVSVFDEVKKVDESNEGKEDAVFVDFFDRKAETQAARAHFMSDDVVVVSRRTVPIAVDSDVSVLSSAASAISDVASVVFGFVKGILGKSGD